jgi:hypothetical protein
MVRERLVILAGGILIAIVAVLILNARSGSTSLKTLASAEADFRCNDRDWNHLRDFFSEVVGSMANCRNHFENPACSHSLKEWAQLPCSLRSYYTTMD